MKIPLHELLLDLRRDLVAERVASRLERLGFAALVAGLVVAAGYRLTTRLARVAPLPGSPGSVGPGRRRGAPKPGARCRGSVGASRERRRR